MMREKMFAELSSLLEVPTSQLTLDSSLASFANWDSLAKVSLLGFVHDTFNVALDPAVLDKLTTLSELLEAVSALHGSTPKETT